MLAPAGDAVCRRCIIGSRQQTMTLYNDDAGRNGVSERLGCCGDRLSVGGVARGRVSTGRSRHSLPSSGRRCWWYLHKTTQRLDLLLLIIVFLGNQTLQPCKVRYEIIGSSAQGRGAQRSKRDCGSSPACQASDLLLLLGLNERYKRNMCYAHPSLRNKRPKTSLRRHTGINRDIHHSIVAS